MNIEIDPELQQFIDQIKPTLDIHPDVVYIKDLKSRLVYVNNKYLDFTGLKDIVGKRGDEIYQNENTDFFIKTDREVIEKKKAVQYQGISETPDKTFHVLNSKSPILNPNGAVIGILGTSRDASIIVEALNTLETVINTVPYPIFIKNLKGVYIKVNDACLTEFGITRDEILGKTDYDFFDKETADFYYNKDLSVIKSKKRVIYMRHQVEDQKRQMIIKDPLYGVHGNIIGVVGISNPYIDLSKIEEQKILNQQKIESMSLLAGGIAHDLNNYLNMVIGVSDILLQDPDRQNRLKLINNIKYATTNASNLIDKLLTFSKQTRKEFSFHNIQEIANNVIDLVKVKGDSKLQFKTHFLRNPTQIHADGGQIYQLLLNLVLNAAESMNYEGTIIISIKEINQDKLGKGFIYRPIELTAKKYISITIEDEGPGIDKSTLSRIFDPYFTTKSTGTGLGLAIVYGVLSTHEGLIRVHSEKNRGTTFQIFLPTHSE